MENPMENLKSYNPATGAVVGEVPVTPLTRIPAVVEAARAAHSSWTKVGAAGRAEILRPVIDRFRTDAERLGTIITLEMGKPLQEGVAEARRISVETRGELHEMVEAMEPDVIEDGQLRSVIHHDPFGVCAAITPWNFPMAMPNWMVLPALVAGNAVVFKPSEETPLSGQAYADVLNEYLPEGVLQVVHGADEQGEALVAADVDLIAFTGSREVGKHILGSAAAGLKRVILELGGKDPMIVLEDADLKDAAEFAAFNSFRNAGQVCVSTEHIFVLDAVAEDFESLLVGHAQSSVVGNGMDEATTIGPMVNEAQRRHVLEQLAEAEEMGAVVLAGASEHPDRFIVPTILADVSPEMSIVREETFGPVVCVTRVSSAEEAIEMANDTPFGLGAVVFGRDEDRAEGIARQLTAGMIGVNRACGGASGSPWVGAKESGYGFHKSRDGHRQFTQTRVVSRQV
jgi:acyl-CoA reductase-like NAD-dependent aldehyde dehydrogenase